MNLGIEGMMLCGAIVAFVTGLNTESLWLAIAAGMAAGTALLLVHAMLTVTLTADQVVSGLAITLFASGFSAYFGKAYTTVEFPAKFEPVYIPILSDIPLLGPVFFQ